MPTATATRELTVTRRGVELVSVGTWDASTGKTKITPADLQAMIDASAADGYDAAPLKVGHDDDRFQDSNGDPPSTRDGQPAYGWIENLRLSPDKKTLLGDFVGVPKMLADVMDTALRRRSVELIRHERVGGSTYAAVLTGVALLGVQAPAVKGLADLRALFADQLVSAPERFSLQISDDTPGVPQSPGALTDGDDQTSDSDRMEAGAAHMKLNPMQRKALGIADGASEEEIAKVLAQMGLKMMAADDDTPPVEITPPAAEPAPTPAPPVAAEPFPPAPEPAPLPVAASAAPTQLTAANIAASASQLGLLVVDPKMYEALSSDAAAGRAARDEQDRVRRDQLVQKAIADGKIAPPAYQAFRAQADKDESAVVALFAAMPASRSMALPAGHAEAFTGGSPTDADTEAKAVADRRTMLGRFFSIPEPAAKG